MRTNPEIFMEGLKKRNADTSALEELLSLDEKWRKLKTQADSLKSEKNLISLQVAEEKKKGNEAKEKIVQTRKLSVEIDAMEKKANSLEAKMEGMLFLFPNTPHESVPVGKDEKENPLVRESALKPKKNSKDALPHYEILQKMGLVDFERGAKISGHRFTFLKGAIARLERALGHFMLDCAVSRGYTEYRTPYLVNEKTMTGTGQLPKFKEELYKCADDDLYLIPTAEVPLTNLFSGEMLKEEELPIKVCALTPCFRREAGAYQKDIKGLIRQHQFDKVELVKFCQAENSFEELEKLVKDAEHVLQKLSIPYRTIELCTGDLGFASAKTYDLEVWLPSQDKYREISSCSNCTDFQSIRANIRYWKGGKPAHLHTLNGSGVAVGRALIAVVENYQDEEGIAIPAPLQDFMQCKRIDYK